MRSKILAIFICLCCTSFAQQTVKYLPSTISSSYFTFSFEYDSIERIKKIELLNKLHGDTNIQTEARTYTYSETDDFSELEENYPTSDSNKETKYTKIKFSEYKKRNHIYVCKIKNLILEQDTSSIYYYTNENGLIKDIDHHSFDFINKTSLEYDSLDMLKSVTEIFTGMGITYTTKTNITPNNSRKGIFRDINFTVISKAAQLKNVFLILADQNPIEIISNINIKDRDLDKENREEHSIIEYKYNKQDYPTQITINNINKDSPTTIEIEYIKVNNEK